MYTASAVFHLRESTAEKASIEGGKTGRQNLALYNYLARDCSQVSVSLFPRQPLKGWEDKVHYGRLGLDMRRNLWKGLLNIRTDSPGRGWSHHPWKCSRNDCIWHLVSWSSWQGGDHLKAGPNDLRGLLKPKRFCSSVSGNRQFF